MAGKALTQAQVIEKLSYTEQLSKKQVKAFLASLSALAYNEAKVGFTLPGIGKLVLIKRKARKGRNPATGESIRIAAKTVVKFKVSKTAKDAIAGVKSKDVPAAKKAPKKASTKKIAKAPTKAPVKSTAKKTIIAPVKASAKKAVKKASSKK